MSKVRRTEEYLADREGRKRDGWGEEDLVVVADATDLWFQLPKEVLADRFVSISSCLF